MEYPLDFPLEESVDYIRGGKGEWSREWVALFPP